MYKYTSIKGPAIAQKLTGHADFSSMFVIYLNMICMDDNICFTSISSVVQQEVVRRAWRAHRSASFNDCHRRLMAPVTVISSPG